MTTTGVHPTALGPLPRTVALQQLGQLYDRLPKIACKGICHDSCTAIDASQLERDLLAKHGVTLPDTTPMAVLERVRETGEIESCVALSPAGRCTVYEARPFVCRAFGAVSRPKVTGPARFKQAMMCDHGCEPEFTVDVPTFMRLMCEIEVLSRAVTGVARLPLPGDGPALLARFRTDNATGYRVGHNLHELSAR